MYHIRKVTSNCCFVVFIFLVEMYIKPLPLVDNLCYHNNFTWGSQKNIVLYSIHLNCFGSITFSNRLISACDSSITAKWCLIATTGSPELKLSPVSLSSKPNSFRCFDHKSEKMETGNAMTKTPVNIAKKATNFPPVEVGYASNCAQWIVEYQTKKYRCGEVHWNGKPWI